MEFVPVKKDDLTAVRRLSKVASEIVKEYYDPILGPEQNDYMIDLFQSPRGILRQLDEGCEYRLAAEDGRALGFLAYYGRGDALYVSKLYLYRQERGRGRGREMIRFLSDEAIRMGLRALELNVNVNNPTTAVYERLGFEKIRSEKNDIGHGYFMDDFVYRKEL